MDREDYRGRSGLARVLLRNFVVYNPLFFLSAMLILLGAGLVNPADASGQRSTSLLGQLQGTIELYQLLLLGAAWIFSRKKRLERDLRFILLVLAPFLVDVTMTTSSLEVNLIRELDKTPANANSLVEVDMTPAYLVAALVLALVAVKAVIAARLKEKRFTGWGWASLLAGPFLVPIFPLVAHRLALEGQIAEKVGLAAGLLLAGLVFLLGRASGERTVRCLSPIAIVGAVVHLGATTWSNGGELFDVAGLLLIALGPVLPRLAWPESAPHDGVTPFVLPVIGVFCLGCGPGEIFGISAWHMGLAGLAATHAVMTWRFRSIVYGAGAFVAFELVCGGSYPEASFEGIGHNVFEPLVLLGIFVEALLRKRSPARLVVSAVLASFLVSRLDFLGAKGGFVAAADVLALCLLSWTHMEHGRSVAGARFRFVGSLLVYVPSILLVIGANGHSIELRSALVLSAFSILALLVLALATRLRVYAIPSVLLVLGVAQHYAPSSASGWGVAGIALGFLVVVLGVLVSLERERLLSWLEVDTAVSLDVFPGNTPEGPALTSEESVPPPPL